MYLFTCVYVYAYVYMCVNIYICIYLFVYMYIYLCMYVCMYVCICMYVYMSYRRVQEWSWSRGGRAVNPLAIRSWPVCERATQCESGCVHASMCTYTSVQTLIYKDDMSRE